MDDWLTNLPIIWTAVVVFGVAYLIAATIYAVVMVLATGERARAFKAVSPGMLPPLGILFGLFVAFTAVQVWNDNDRRRNQSIVRLAPTEPLRSLSSLYRED